MQKVTQRLSSQDIAAAAMQDLKQAFKDLAQDGSGKIQIHQACDKIRRVLTLNVNLEKIMRIPWSLEVFAAQAVVGTFLLHQVRTSTPPAPTTPGIGAASCPGP